MVCLFCFVGRNTADKKLIKQLCIIVLCICHASSRGGYSIFIVLKNFACNAHTKLLNFSIKNPLWMEFNYWWMQFCSKEYS